MMTRRLLILSCLLLGATAACASDSDGTIDYQMTGGLGGIHSAVHINPDGGMTGVKTDGSKVSTRLTDQELDALELKISEADFPTLDAMYGCGGCADDFVHTISVHVAGAVYTVRVDDSAAYPDRLRPVIVDLSARVRPELESN